MKRKFLAGIAAATTAVLAACGGGNSGGSSPTPTAPGAASNCPAGSGTSGNGATVSIGSKASRAILTANGIAILPSVKGASDAIRKAIAQARSAGGCDLVILDGPAMPWTSVDRRLLDIADGLVAILPASLDINDSMEEIITALGSAQRKLVGVIVNELSSPSPMQQRGKQYA